MKSKELFENIKSEIEVIYESPEAKEISFLLLEHYFNLSKTAVLLNEEVTQTNFTDLDNAMLRLKSHEPIQYILGETWFLGRKFIVSKAVLIPRPETEELVDLICKENNKSALKIIDFCTGSGCIAISLEQELQNSEVFAYEISENALEIARQNAVVNHSEVKFIQQDILQDFLIEKNIDIIVSNPPYVCDSEKNEMNKNVLDFEPHIALFVEDNNPLLFYERIIKIAEKTLKIDGSIYFEINEKLGKDIIEFAKICNFNQSKLIKDFRGRDRMIKLWR